MLQRMRKNPTPEGGVLLQQEKSLAASFNWTVESPTLLPKKMSYFYGFERRFTVSIMFVFLLGWLLYLIGLIVGGVSYTMPDAYIIKLDLIPRILFVLCGLILFSLKLFYAGLSRKASSVFGSISAFVTVLVLLSLGYALVVQPFSVASVIFSWIGGGICAHCLCIDLIVSTLYKDFQPEEVYQIPHNRLFQGLARKLVILPVLLWTVGWILVTAGTVNFGETGVLYDIFGIFAIGFVVAHAGSWGSASPTIGIAAVYMISLYCFYIGRLFFGKLITLSVDTTAFSGSLISFIAMACILALWPFYQRPGLWTTDSRNSEAEYTQVHQNNEDAFEEQSTPSPLNQHDQTEERARDESGMEDLVTTSRSIY